MGFERKLSDYVPALLMDLSSDVWAGVKSGFGQPRVLMEYVLGDAASRSRHR